jgi:hypothetical protein
MYHRAGGLVVATTGWNLNASDGDHRNALRVEDQDWSTLVLHAFPAHPASTSAGVHVETLSHGRTRALTRRAVFSRSVDDVDGRGGARTEISMAVSADSPTRRPEHRSAEGSLEVLKQQPLQVRLRISRASDGAPRAWLLRLHLRPGQQVLQAAVTVGAAHRRLLVRHLSPRPEGASSGSVADDFLPFGGRGAPPPPNAGPVAELELPPSTAETEVRLALLGSVG